MNKKIGFKDLSTSLKVLVGFGWFMFGMYCLFFLIGLLEGILLV